MTVTGATGPKFAVGEAVRLISNGVELGTFPISGVKTAGKGWYYSLDGINKQWPESSLEPVRKGDRFTVYTAKDALEPQPPIAWIIEDLFSKGSVSLLVGKGGCGKTYAMLDAAVCVALGEDWLGCTTAQQGALIVDEESGKRRLSRRLGATMRGHSADKSLPLSYVTLERVNLLTRTDTEALEKLVADTGAGFVLVDALADVMPGGDENAVADVHPVFMELRGIAERQHCACIVIHHTNKIGSYRGSTSMQAAVDLLLSVEKEDDDLEFEVQKARDVEAFKFSAKMYFGPDEFCLASGGALPTLSESKRYVLSYLRDNGESRVQDIEDNAKICAPSTARSSLYELIGEDLIERVDEGKRGQVALYNLTKDGHFALAML